MEKEEFDKTTEQEVNLRVITLVANRICNNGKRPRGMMIREIAMSLQYISRSEMLIGVWSEENGEPLLLMVKSTLTRSLELEDDDMCPALTPGIYLVE